MDKILLALNGDTLNNPLLKENDRLMQFDVIVANPPFSLDKWGEKHLENDIYNRFDRGMPPASKGDYAFISHMIATAKPRSGRVSYYCSARCFVPWFIRRKN